MKKRISRMFLTLLLPFSGLSGCGQKSYTITWVNDDGTVLEVDKNVKKGEMPTYDGLTPTKADDEHYSYEFMNWYTAVVPACKDETYTAQYVRTVKSNDDGLSLDPLDIAIKAGKALIENFVPHGKQIISVVSALIGCFTPDEKGKKTPLDKIKDDLDALRDEITKQYQEIESELASLSEQQRQIEEKLEKIIIDQTALSSKAKDFDTLLTNFQATARQISSIENDGDLTPQDKSVQLALLIGCNDKWVSSDNLYNQYLNFLNTLTGTTFEDLNGRDLLTIIYDEYTTNSLFTGEAKNSAELYFNQVVYLAFFAYSIISECFKAAEEVSCFTADDLAKLNKDNRGIYDNKEVATLNSVIIQENEYLNRKVLQVDFKESSLAGRMDSFYNGDFNRHILINNGTMNVNMADTLFSREYKDGAFVKDGSEYDNWNLETLYEQLDKNATFDTNARQAVVDHVKANFNGTLRDYLTILGYDLTNVPQGAYFYLEFVEKTEDGEMNPHTLIGYYYLTMGFKVVDIDDDKLAVIDLVPFSKHKVNTDGTYEDIPVDGGYILTLRNA